MIRLIFAISCIWATSHAVAQVKKEEVTIEQPDTLPTTKKSGRFYPLFWNAVIEKEKEDGVGVEKEHAFVELSKVQTFAKQRYRVNGNVVRELTVVLENKLFIRFYHFEEQKIIPNGIQEKVSSLVGGDKDVEKTYPDTTHKEMLEFRLPKSEHIDLLFKDFRKTFLAYKMKEYVEEQREEVVSQVKVKTATEE